MLYKWMTDVRALRIEKSLNLEMETWLILIEVRVSYSIFFYVEFVL